MRQQYFFSLRHVAFRKLLIQSLVFLAKFLCFLLLTVPLKLLHFDCKLPMLCVKLHHFTLVILSQFFDSIHLVVNDFQFQSQLCVEIQLH